MTKFVAEEKCTRCHGALVPPVVVAKIDVPAHADYICLTCGCAYVWLGNPPLLVRITGPVASNAEPVAAWREPGAALSGTGADAIAAGGRQQP